MRTIKICIGSACHLKGSYEVIEGFKRLIKEYELEEKIELKAAFCLGFCTDAVTVERWDGKILSMSRENLEEIFKDQIYAEL